MSRSQVCQTFRAEPKERVDLDFSNWFESDWLSANLRTVVECVTVRGDSSSGLEGWEASHVEGEILTPSSDGAASMLMLEEATGQAEDMAMVPVSSEFRVTR